MVDFSKYIKEAYKDLSEPDYGFVKAALNGDRYLEIGPEFVKMGFVVEDDTEPNTDVCRTLILSKEDSHLCIKLSFVGPFAAVFPLNDMVPAVESIVTVLSAYDLHIVQKDLLVQPYDINLLDVDADPTLYNALFSSDMIPV